RLPGAGDRGGDGALGLLRLRGRGAAAGDEQEALAAGDRVPPPTLRRGGRGARRRAGDRRAGLGTDPGLLRLRLPQGALGGVRPARLPVSLAAGAPRAGVPLLAAERAADGLLPARLARPRGPAAWHPRGAAGRQRQPRALPRRVAARGPRAARRPAGADRPRL